jgi:hypothetical protein
LKTLGSGRRRKYLQHMSALEVRDHISEEHWNSYFKFCIERNPWDKALSYYWWCGGEESAAVDDFLTRCNLPQGFELYSKSGKIIVDEVLRYESLESDLERLSEKLRMKYPISVKDIHAKSDEREDKRHYREILGAETVEHIRRVYAREIAYFNYSY